MFLIPNNSVVSGDEREVKSLRRINRAVSFSPERQASRSARMDDHNTDYGRSCL